MLRIKNIATTTAIILLFAVFSCSKTEIRYNPQDNTSIAYLRQMYGGYPYTINDEITIMGTVVSSDRDGNFYKTIVIEDSTAGLEVKIDMQDSFKNFGIGKQVIIRCSGLTLGMYGGLLQLGVTSTDAQYQTGYIPQSEIAAHIKLVDQATREITAHELSITELSPRYVSCRVKISDVQFVDQEVGERWGDPLADIDRHIIDRDGNTIAVRISSYAVFTSYKLPTGSGGIEGILSYFNSRYQLRPVSDYDQSMDKKRF